MRAVHTVDSLGAHHGGPSRSITSLCSALAELDTTVDLLAIGRRPGELEPMRPTSDAVCVHFADAGHGGLAALLRPGTGFIATLSRLARERETVLHDHGLWLLTNHSSAAIARRHDVPRIVSTRGMLSSWALKYRRWKKELAWRAFQSRDLRRATVLHVTSEQEAQEIRDVGLRQPLAIIPNGVAIPDVGLCHETSKGRERQALFLARVHPKKGVMNLVSAWSIVRPSGWRLTIAGPDDIGHRRDVASFIAREGLSDVIQLRDEVAEKDKWKLYSDSDLFLLPTFNENFGIAIAEALGMGIPVITTKGAPWPSIPKRGCGWWTDTGTEALVSALREATAIAPEQLAEMGRRGRQYVLGEFSWSRVARDMREVYEWVLHGGEAPSCVAN